MLVSIENTKVILAALGMPNEQLNDRSALTLLALGQLTPKNNWQDASNSMRGVTPIMRFIRDNWGCDYAPNTRENIRRQTLHQFISGGICAYNPDDPERAINSPKACYQIIPKTLQVIRSFGSTKWDKTLQSWKSQQTQLIDQYAHARNLARIPITLSNGEELHLSPGKHSALIRDIVLSFSTRFAHGSFVVYLGDTGAKSDFFDSATFASINLDLNIKGKLPDVVLINKEKKWLFLIESATSHGPVDEKRYLELKNLFKPSNYGLIFISAFPNKKIMKQFMADIAWETEVWLADNPDHLIHLNGDRFFGPR